MQLVPHTYLHPSHFPLRQVALSGPHPRYRYPFGFMQTTFCSHCVSTVNTLRSSSSLPSAAGTCQLLCSLFLIKVCLGFFDTIVSCFCSYLFHAFHWMPSFVVPMGSVLDVLSLPQESPLFPGDDPEGRELIFCPTPNSPLSLEPQTLISDLWCHHKQQASPHSPSRSGLDRDTPPPPAIHSDTRPKIWGLS